MDETLPQFALGKRANLLAPMSHSHLSGGLTAFCLPDGLKRFDISQAPALRLNT